MKELCIKYEEAINQIKENKNITNKVIKTIMEDIRCVSSKINRKSDYDMVMFSGNRLFAYHWFLLDMELIEIDKKEKLDKILKDIDKHINHKKYK